MNSLKQALERIVKDQDFSRDAAAALESEIANRHSEDERLVDLENVLASYRPGGGEFLFDEKALERECIQVLKLF